MKRTRHTAAQIIRKLKTAQQLIAQGKNVVEVCRVIEVTQPTYHRWRQQYGGEALGSCRGKLLSLQSCCAAKRTSRCDRAVAVLHDGYRASERFVCRVAGQHRSTQCHGGKVVDLEETKLRNRLRVIASEHIRWGRRMAYRPLMREGWTVNHKRVERLWHA